jgi:hypothetical protein
MLAMAAPTAADRQGRELCSATLSGGVNISFPFGIVPEHATESNCGMLGFQVHCPNNTPYIGSYNSDYWFKILDIFYDNGSCSSPMSTSLKVSMALLLPNPATPRRTTAPPASASRSQSAQLTRT